jgi:aconitate hydratase
MNVTQKILHSHLVEGTPEPGSKAGIRIDQTLTQDATGTMAYLEFEAMGIDKVKTELSVSYVDHNTAQMGPNNMNDHLYLKTVAANIGVYYSQAGNGICHQVHLERFGAPGKTLLGSDSHTPTGGGIGMLAIGAGGLNVALAMAGEPFMLTWPKVIGIHLTGELQPWVAAKDVILKLLSILSTKGNVGCIVEYFGEGVETLSVPQRATITNMGAELGVTTSVFPSDERTKQFLAAQQREKDWIELMADPDAEYDRVIELNLSELEPLVTQSPSPDNVKTFDEVAGTKVNQVIIGSCTNSSYRDLTMAAEVLRGRRIHPSVSFAVAPGSRQVLQMITRSGALSTFITAGARILESACGPCIGQGYSPAEDTVSVRTFNRNFAGRTGTRNDNVFLASPEVAIVAALTGKLTDPRVCGIEYPVVTEPESFDIDDWLIVPPPSSPPPIRRASTIGDPPKNTSLPEAITGTVLVKVADKITTDHIMPAGIYLKLRSNIPEYAKVVFNCFNEEGQPTFAERAGELRDSGGHGIIVAGESYGQGSSREHAAICPMYLGIKAVIAKSFERIHRDNLVNFGILPLQFADQADYEKIGENGQVELKDICTQLQNGTDISATLQDGTTITLTHNLTAKELDMVLAGGRLNMFA